MVEPCFHFCELALTLRCEPTHLLVALPALVGQAPGFGVRRGANVGSLGVRLGDDRVGSLAYVLQGFVARSARGLQDEIERFVRLTLDSLEMDLHLRLDEGEVMVNRRGVIPPTNPLELTNERRDVQRAPLPCGPTQSFPRWWSAKAITTVRRCGDAQSCT